MSSEKLQNIEAQGLMPDLSNIQGYVSLQW